MWSATLRFKAALRLNFRHSGVKCAGWLLAIALASPLETRLALARQDDPVAHEFFEKTIRPLLSDRCCGCHGPEKSKNGLRLDTRAGMLTGGDSGPAVVPGRPDDSLIIQAVRYDDLLRMPPKAKLPDADVKSLEKWVEMGAPWPPGGDDVNPGAIKVAGSETFDLRERARHWSFQPLAQSVPPTVSEAEWPSNPIDNFILKAQEEHNLGHAGDADRVTLIRRLYFDLTGLPPRPEDVSNFVNDTRPDAYEQLVDRLLASPHYGERWARHWLDLVRFVETSGHEFDYEILFAWRYRDYVIRALNADVPYDRFVVEQIAGDLLTEPRLDPASHLNESIVGPAFYWFGDGTHSPVDAREEQLRRIDNQIDVMGKAFLGLTIACARCHDHKFDPITQRDYYALAGFLKSSRYTIAEAEQKPARDELAERLRVIGRTLGLRVGLSLAENPAQKPQDDEQFESFDDLTFQRWRATGLAFGKRPSEAGDVHFTADGKARAVNAGIAHSALGSESLHGILRSETFTIEHSFIHYLVAGRRSRIQLVVSGFEKIRDPIYGGLARAIEHGEEPRWVTQDISMWRGQRAYIELVDGEMPDFTAGTTQILPSDGFIAVDEIRFSDSGAPELSANKPSEIAVDTHSLEASEVALLEERQRIESELAKSTPVLTMVDGTGEDESLLARGNARNPIGNVPRRFLEVMGVESALPSREGSGRLDLAAHVVDPANPLISRVAVNRLWLHHFGRGLVPSPDDFGRMGQPPSHPELLDWLARKFIASDYSLKHINRLILTSRTYRMASSASTNDETLDPENVWLHRTNLRRLEAESIRDTLLAVSGRLDRGFYGPSIATHLTPFMEGRGRPGSSGPLDGAGRRSIYQNLRRNFLPPFLLAFDLPTPSSTMGRRNISNVPTQALALLDDPLVIEQAAVWADRICKEIASADKRIDRMYLEAFGRFPDASERAGAHAFIDHDASLEQRQCWVDFAHVLFNTKELIYIP
jgi:hypothetical protein